MRRRALLTGVPLTALSYAVPASASLKGLTGLPLAAHYGRLAVKAMEGTASAVHWQMTATAGGDPEEAISFAKVRVGMAEVKRCLRETKAILERETGARWAIVGNGEDDAYALVRVWDTFPRVSL